MSAQWLNDFVTQYRGDPDIVDVFGVILYTDAHANVKKLLSDPDYWKALNERSGPHWVVFAVRSARGQWTSPRGFGEDTFGLMVPVWKEPRENRELLDLFEFESTEHLPQMLVFASNAKGHILSRSMRVSDDSVDRAYQSLSEAMDLVAKAVSQVAPEHRQGAGAFGAINAAISGSEDWKRIKKVVSLIPWVSKLVGAVRG